MMHPAWLSPLSREPARWKPAPACMPRGHSPADASSVRHENRAAKPDVHRSRGISSTWRPMLSHEGHYRTCPAPEPLVPNTFQSSPDAAARVAPYPEEIRGPLIAVVLVIADDCRAPSARMSPV